MNIAEIITIGDEILIGQTIDSNSAFIGEYLSKIGFEIRQITSISDNPNEIVRALDEAILRADLIIITGGLGPTKDDLTKKTLADYFNSSLVRDEQVLNDINILLRNRKVPMNELNIAQADVPDKCQIIRNSLGTAPGMVFEKESRVIISLPGVPYEMKAIVEDQFPGILGQKFSNPDILHKMVMTSGYPESYLASLISDWEDGLPEFISLAYLPSPGVVKLRLSGRGKSRDLMESTINTEIRKLEGIIPQAIFSLDNINLEEAVGRRLLKLKQTVSTAESCTGGSIASLLTSVPGSSEYFRGSVVAYHNTIKREILDVPQQMLLDHGAVSKKVVESMARNMRLKFKTDYSIAVSGIAGPGGGTEDKPVGTVWIAVASQNGVTAKRYLFGKKRELNIQRASMAALNLLWKNLTS